MQLATQAFNRDVTQQIPLGFVEQGDGLEKTEARALDVATIVLDASGTIRYCDPEAARLFGAGTYLLQGQPIGALIPDLPLKPKTRGYNIAYASFCAAAAPRCRFSGVHSQGRRFGLDVTLATLKLDDGYHIRLSLGPALAPPERAVQFAGRGAAAVVRAEVETHA